MDKNVLDSPQAVVAAIGSGTAAIIVFALMPVLVGGLADRFALDDLQSGLIATAYFSTYATVALTSPLWVRRWNWRWVALAGYVLMLASLGQAMLADSFAVARLAMAASGLGAGLLYPISLTLVSDMLHTQRVYSIKLSIEQLVPAALLVMMSLGVVIGAELGDILLAVMCTVTICLLASLAMPVSGRREATAAVARGHGSILAGLLALIALGINFAGFAGLWVFMERIAVDNGFEPGFTNLWLAVGLITSGIGPLIAAVIGNRYGYYWPVLLSTLATLGAIGLLVGEVNQTVYALVLTLLPLFYYISISYFFSIVVAADANGKLSGLMSFALAVGSAAGPALFGAFKSDSGPALLVMGLCVALGTLLILYVARGQSTGTAQAAACKNLLNRSQDGQ